MTAPTKYKSVFTGAEIDAAIATMRASLGGGIINDFTTGGVNNVASAELVKTLKGIVDTNDLPANLKSQLTSIADSHLLTDAEYASLNGIFSTATSFRGSYANAAARDAALATQYASYTGVELSFIVDDGSGTGSSELSLWNAVNDSWHAVQFNTSGAAPITAVAASAINLATYNTTRFSAIKVLVQVSTTDGTQRQIQEVLLSHVVADTYISVYSEVGNSSSLFTLTSSINTSTHVVTLILTTLVPNVVYTAKVLALI